MMLEEMAQRGRAVAKAPIPNSKFRIPNSEHRKIFAAGEASERYAHNKKLHRGNAASRVHT
jgi:hypothetical protein